MREEKEEVYGRENFILDVLNLTDNEIFMWKYLAVIGNGPETQERLKLEMQILQHKANNYCDRND